MDHFLDAVRLAVSQGNHQAALFISLSLPDICIRLEADPDVKVGRGKYIAWFDTYMAKHYTREIGFPPKARSFMTGKDCYALRCALLHSGKTQIDEDEIRTTLEKIHFSDLGMHCIKVNDALLIDATTFCRQLCSAVEGWTQHFKANCPDKQHRLDELLAIHTAPFVMNMVQVGNPD